ncbi:MAG: hypothetical protein P1P64_09075 [Treponemataceae bacterium]
MKNKLEKMQKIFNLKFLKFLSLAFFVLFFWSSLNAQNTLSSEPTTSNSAIASEEFRRGVQSYYRGQFNEAIMTFEKALAYLPNEAVIRDWLGKAYFRSGLEAEALEQWKIAYSQNYGASLLRTRIETIEERRTPDRETITDYKYAEQVALKSKDKGNVFFVQPTSVFALSDGSFWLVAYGSNELVHFDVNGVIKTRSRGPIQGLARPFDLAQKSDGTLIVSEFAGDKISFLDSDGKFIKSFGSKGIGDGQFVGPQYIALDSFENIYITDFGSARIAVFSPDGEFLFNFGERSNLFEGFIAPSGIAIFEDLVYVSDSYYGAVFKFDTAGNFLGELLPKGALKNANGLRAWKDALLVLDRKSAYRLDVSTATLTELVSLGNAPTRLLAVTSDVNSNLLLVDYKNQEIKIASTIKELAGGLFVSVQKVISENYPEVVLDVLVENRNGQPVVGLNESNFFVTEKNAPVADFKFDAAGHLNTDCDITIIVERSMEGAEDTETIQQAVAEIVKAVGTEGRVKVVSASENPSFEQITKDGLDFKSTVSPAWKLDKAIRLATNDLVDASPKRAVIYLSSGGDLMSSFLSYSLNDLAAFMSNNGVRFYAINLHRNAIPAEVQYLTYKTGGSLSYVYESTGLAPIIKGIALSPSGLYRMSFNSKLFSNFGRDFIPVEVEVRLMTRSGRDEIQYFAPLE